jgi:colanic acid/amylovoran biosynthesis glycosyltransferase
MPRATQEAVPGVAHFHTEFLGRSETFIYRILLAFQRVRPVVFTRRLRYLEEFPFAPIVLYPPAPVSPWGILDRVGRRFFRREAFLARQFRRHAVRLLHAHFGPMGWELLRVADATGLPLVTTFYGYDMSMLPAHGDWTERYRSLFTSGALFLVEGPHMRAALISLGCPAEKVRIQRIGINLALIPFRPRGPAVGRPARLLFCGRLTEKKGLLDALEAVAAVRARHPQVEFRILGDGEERPRAERLIMSLGLRDCVRLLGLQPYEIVQRELAAADILLAPSRTASDGDSEGGAPTILLEAQAAGLPVVATTHADIPYVVVAGKSGLLAPEGDPAALAECLRSLLETPERWAEMGRAGRRHVEQEHDVRTTAAGLEETYFALMSGRP